MYKILDPHVHFIDLEKGDYAWLLPQNPPFWPDKTLVNKNTMPEDLQLSDDFSLQGAVHVEAGFDNINPVRELEWLESQVYSQAVETPFVSIGHIDICAESTRFQQYLDEMLRSKSLRGFRYTFVNTAPVFEQRAQITQNLTRMSQAKLLFEFQADFTQTGLIKEIFHILRSLLELRVVINHAGLPPPCDSATFGLYQENMKTFADLPKCYVKCSGFEMTSRTYTVEHVCSVLSVCAELFGSERMMVASNFPLTQLTMAYAAYWEMMLACVKQIGLPVDKVLHTNAKMLYGFEY